MSEKKLSKSQKIIQYCMNYYLEEMEKLNNMDYDDDCIKDMEDWGAIEGLISRSKEGEIPDRDSLLLYFGNKERADLTLAYYYIARDLLENGATLYL